MVFFSLFLNDDEEKENIFHFSHVIPQAFTVLLRFVNEKAALPIVLVEMSF